MKSCDLNFVAKLKDIQSLIFLCEGSRENTLLERDTFVQESLLAHHTSISAVAAGPKITIIEINLKRCKELAS